MPCIIIRTNQKISEQQKLLTCQSTSALISSLLAKPERYVMAIMEHPVSMTMAGTNEPAAYIELKSINLPEQQTTELSRQICQYISKQLDINGQRIYIEFSNAQRHLWGWDSKTF